MWINLLYLYHWFFISTHDTRLDKFKIYKSYLFNIYVYEIHIKKLLLFVCPNGNNHIIFWRIKTALFLIGNDFGDVFRVDSPIDLLLFITTLNLGFLSVQILLTVPLSVELLCLNSMTAKKWRSNKMIK